MAGIAHVAVAVAGAAMSPYLYGGLIAVAYGLMLPSIAVLHPRHRHVRDSGAILATIAGTSVVTIGLTAAADPDLRIPALFVLALWWWTVGKMWAETGALPRGLGRATAALGVVTFAAALIPSSWQAVEIALGLWLVALAVALNGAATDVPSR